VAEYYGSHGVVPARRAKGRTMRPNFRSISGAALMLVIIPIFAGLLACMPEYVPLGNPERARIDEDMSGMWFVADYESEELIGQFVFLEPWDKRTWLVSNVAIGDIFSTDPSTYDEFVDLFGHPELDLEDFGLGLLQYKGWLVKLGGETFMTWELRTLFDNTDQLLEPWFWYDLRVTERTPDRMVLHLIDPDFPPLKEAPAERRAWEKVVKKHADNEKLYYEDEVVLERVKEDDLELFVELLSHALLGSLD